jgi:hypothetical protein
MIEGSSHRWLKMGLPQTGKTTAWGKAGIGASQRTKMFRERGSFRERGRRRTRQDQISQMALRAGETADHEIRTERRKLVSSAGRIFSERTPRKDDPAV